MKMIFFDPNTMEEVDSIEISDSPDEEEKKLIQNKMRENLRKGNTYRYEGEE